MHVPWVCYLPSSGHNSRMTRDDDSPPFKADALDCECSRTTWEASVQNSTTFWLLGCMSRGLPTWWFFRKTHWGLGKQDGQWSIGSWHFLTSADPQARYAGVCICISDKLASRDDISYSTWVPGRVLHARLTGHTVPIDIVAVYQWVMQDRQPEQAKRNRSRLCAQLTANAWAATWARVSSQGSAPRTLNWRDFYRRLISVWSTRGTREGCAECHFLEWRS